ncbi:hypothetical protein KQX54_008017 [Cotesia glomerata]|uniref:Uncharacterized protein n=1 Tax=Cotesia glomerata TaxID=32391 RepID=A0AAV7IUX8_COTGL|nr:hypothetical protein KQX54_008017 [Cotesia glomerata]
MYVDGENYGGFTTFFQWAAIDCGPEDMFRLSFLTGFMAATDHPAAALGTIRIIEERCGFLPPELKLARAFLQSLLLDPGILRLPNAAEIEVLSENLDSMARSVSGLRPTNFQADCSDVARLLVLVTAAVTIPWMLLPYPSLASDIVAPVFNLL